MLTFLAHPTRASSVAVAAQESSRAAENRVDLAAEEGPFTPTVLASALPGDPADAGSLRCAAASHWLMHPE